jgi:integrase
MASASGAAPSVEQAVQAFFQEFDFGEGGERTRLSYRSGAKVFLHYVDEHDKLNLGAPVDALPSSLSADFKAWLGQARHAGPGPEGEHVDKPNKPYSPATIKLYLQSLHRLQQFWWYRDWLSYSPEEETRARQALQVQRGRSGRQKTRTRSPEVPADFGPRMVKAVEELPHPSEEEVPDPKEQRKIVLETLRAKALIHLLRASALRAGDAAALTRAQVELARRNNGYLALPMRKTGLPAHIVLGASALEAIEAYIKGRADASPWVFIQHGTAGQPSRSRRLSEDGYRKRRRGYGARLGTGSIRQIVLRIARRAGYRPKKEFVSAHAFRHWHAQELIRKGASIDQVQSVLGHARAQTTKEVYAPEPNVARILEIESILQD